MKYKVIGWTDWDGDDVVAAEVSDAATEAIIDDIRKQQYKLTGFDHQERMNCAPVLNDGKKRLYSQRGFAALMAKAYDYRASNDYALFLFNEDDVEDDLPPMELRFDPDSFISEDISEHYTLDVSEQLFDTAQHQRKLVIDDSPEIRFIDCGDTATLKCNGKSADYKIEGVSKEKDFSEEDRIALDSHLDGAEEKWQNAKIIVTIHLEK